MLTNPIIARAVPTGQGDARTQGSTTQYHRGEEEPVHTTDSDKSGGLGFFGWYFILLLLSLLIAGGICAFLWYKYKDLVKLSIYGPFGSGGGSSSEDKGRDRTDSRSKVNRNEGRSPRDDNQASNRNLLAPEDARKANKDPERSPKPILKDDNKKRSHSKDSKSGKDKDRKRSRSKKRKESKRRAENKDGKPRKSKKDKRDDEILRR